MILLLPCAPAIPAASKRHDRNGRRAHPGFLARGVGDGLRRYRPRPAGVAPAPRHELSTPPAATAEDDVAEIEYAGAEHAEPAPGVIEAIEAASIVVIAPSNPPLSIRPILEIRAIEDALAAHPKVVAISPFFGGKALKGPADRVMGEARDLVERGVREVTLLGQNVNAYRGATHDGDNADLAELIRCVAAIDGIDRIRFTTSHPVEFSDSLIDVYAEVPELVSHLHLPVQSGSDRILMAMKRGHTVLEYKSKLRRIKKLRPDISFSSDFIIGFPNETEADFEATMNLIAEIGFDQSFSFIYSRRPGTPAASLPDDVPSAVKQERLALLQARIRQQAAEISRGMVGSVQKVLVERQSKKNPGQLAGRTENMRWVNFDGPRSLIGQFVGVLITEALPNSLRGRIEDATRAA